jgi:hypothetical protein
MQKTFSRHALYRYRAKQLKFSDTFGKNPNRKRDEEERN